jgi:cbb3-type cytochrome oxidase maturation protein
MEVLVFLVPLAVTLGAIGLMGFLWSLKNGQYDDLEGAGWRAIADDEPVSEETVPAASTGNGHRQGAVERVSRI